MRYVWVGLFGTAGALSRYLLGLHITGALQQTFPWAALLINLTGTFLLGLLSGLGERRLIPEAWQAPLTTGFLGSFTTFSSWMVDTLLFLQSGSYQAAALNLILSIGLGLPIMWVGLAAGRRQARQPELPASNPSFVRE